MCRICAQKHHGKKKLFTVSSQLSYSGRVSEIYINELHYLRGEEKTGSLLGVCVAYAE